MYPELLNFNMVCLTLLLKCLCFLLATVKILEDEMKRTCCGSPRQGPCTQNLGENGPVACDLQHICFFSQGRCYNGDCKTRDNQCQYIWGTSRLHLPAWWPHSVLFTALSSSLWQRYPAWSDVKEFVRGFWFNSHSTSNNDDDDDAAKIVANRDIQVRSCHANQSVSRWPWLLCMGCYSYLPPQGWVPRSLSDHLHNRMTCCVPCWFACGEEQTWFCCFVLFFNCHSLSQLKWWHAGISLGTDRTMVTNLWHVAWMLIHVSLADTGSDSELFSSGEPHKNCPTWLSNKEKKHWEKSSWGGKDLFGFCAPVILS